MKAAVVDQPGGLDTILIREVDIPQPGPGQVLIKVSYCGCNWADTQMREGIYPHKTTYPLILGMEVAGEVVDVGPNVSHPQPGQRITAMVEGGGYANFCVASAGLATVVPEGLPMASAAAYPVQGLTAYHMLYTVGRISDGDTVLVHASGGGVGLFVTQLAVRAGATVIGTVGTSGKEEKPLAYGATQVINLKEGNFAEQVLDLTQGKGVDLAIDSLGATTLDKTFSAVRMLGHLINIGEAEGQPIENIRQRCLVRSQTFTRFHLGHVMEIPSLWKDGNDFVLDALIAGWLDPTIVEIFPLEQARQMHERIEDRSNSGKLLLQADPSAAIG
ncbi:MAG TPA: hypothetical protein EYM68_09060 [Gammaproteobacteria bacterium]|jgi:NADPH2:quinone reductase|nr:hypothetical protein [Gammaproteobacteria bacterium]HIN18035.1 hypothetical protein [Gammaproteobacteria bacterium]HIO18471.1 hypothetical protein [Gammaproteobacteria bacterium]HIO34556.1 hypothetical protein [Gammaproteobacteria bacterium]HIP05888.1 hypothetical protein [Gammaproteobacteria bacterium]|tara:strand:- start:1768 stop:2760 length:993 start_codon:yes stop_codon:yes gene_type:complete